LNADGENAGRGEHFYRRIRTRWLVQRMVDIKMINQNRSVLYFFLLVVFIAGIIFPWRVATLQQDDAVSQNEQGLKLLAAGKFKEAAAAFEQAIKYRPEYPEAYDHLGDAYLELGEVKKSVEAFKRVIKHKPASALAYNKLGVAYREQRDYNKAVDAFKESIRLNSSDPMTHFNLGLAYFYNNKMPAAVAEYKTLQTLSPEIAQDLYNLIYTPTIPVVKDQAVRLRLMAIDAHGSPVTGLKSEDFQVTEEGAHQTVSLVSTGNTPTYFQLVADTSGSLRSNLPFVLAVSNQVVERMMPHDQTGLVRFISSDKIETVREFTSNKKSLSAAIDSLYIEGGHSAVLDAVYLSAQHLAGHKFPNRNVRRVLFLLTDGDDRSSYYNLQQVLTLLRSVDIQVFVVSLASKELTDVQLKQAGNLLRTLSAETGGIAFFPKSPAELEPTVNLIFDLVRAAYTIEYKPTKPTEAGTYRSVSVTLAPTRQGDRFSLISRPGYVPPAK